MTTEQNQTLSDWLNWMEACHPSEIELGLDRIKQVYSRLGVDLSASTVVTVAGTNGKGSTVSYLRQIYQDAGLTVGCYTSPHFIAYNERVTLNGVNTSDDQLCKAFELIDQARGDIPLTYFEFGTLAALVVFAQEKPDLVLLEVGLGGRLDAVNIIDADISVVTTVAIDHVDWLGDNREVIGFEKAGVFRQGRPAICGDLNPPQSVAEHAEKIGAKLYQAKAEFSFSKQEDVWSWQGINAEDEDIAVSDIPLPQLPLQNASTAMQVVMQLPFKVEIDQVKRSIANARLTGRMQHFSKENVQYWLDVAHNPEAANHLRQQVNDLPGSKVLILGMLADKDCQQVIDLLLPTFETVHLAGLNVPRGQTAEALKQFCHEGAELHCHQSVEMALAAIKNTQVPPENVIIAGSFFTVSEALTVLTGS